MTKRYRKKIRKKGYNYKNPGFYFVTICVYGRRHDFGEIQCEKMNQNAYGDIAEQTWNWIEKQYPYIRVVEQIIMPNHLHAVIQIIDQKNNIKKQKSLSRIIGAYKQQVTMLVRKREPTFAWQRSFHDHIIQNQQSLYNIIQYIKNNPKNWGKNP